MLFVCPGLPTQAGADTVRTAGPQQAVGCSLNP